MIKKLFNRFYKKDRQVVTTEDDTLFKRLRTDTIAIDCGANVGNVTAKMAATGATVYAFEPNPYAFKVLQQRFQAMPNVHCFNQGVLDRNTTLKLYLHEHSDEDEVHWSTGSSFLAYKGNVLKDKYVEIEVIDLDAFIQQLPQNVTLLKLDVEGVEVEILNKLIDTNTIRKIEYVVCETHDEKIPELKESTEKLRKRIAQENIRHVNLNWI